MNFGHVAFDVMRADRQTERQTDMQTDMKTGWSAGSSYWTCVLGPRHERDATRFDSSERSTQRRALPARLHRCSVQVFDDLQRHVVLDYVKDADVQGETRPVQSSTAVRWRLWRRRQQSTGARYMITSSQRVCLFVCLSVGLSVCLSAYVS